MSRIDYPQADIREMSWLADYFYAVEQPGNMAWAEDWIRREEAELEMLLLLQFDPLEEGESERV
jgi:hypothetical protein